MDLSIHFVSWFFHIWTCFHSGILSPLENRLNFVGPDLRRGVVILDEAVEAEGVYVGLDAGEEGGGRWSGIGRLGVAVVRLKQVDKGLKQVAAFKT